VKGIGRLSHEVSKQTDQALEKTQNRVYGTHIGS
jgi:hypothetical protein